MPRLLLAPLALALLALPRPANACDYLPQFIAGLPAEGAVAPANTQAFAWAPFMGRSEMVAELYDPRAAFPIPVDVRSLGEDVVQLDLPPLDPGIAYAAEVRMVGIDQAHRFDFTVSREVDEAPPPAPSVLWDAHEGPANSCESSGFYFDLTIDRVPGAVLYELNELMPNDAIVPVGARFESDEATPSLFLSAYVGREPLNGRCFFVSAVDQAGNRSAAEDLYCVTPIGRPDSGVPGPIDAGLTPDAGSSAPDAGSSAPDAGTGAPDAAPGSNGLGTGLESQDAGCGCTAAGAPREGGFAGLLLVAAVTLRRRRRSA